MEIRDEGINRLCIVTAVDLEYKTAIGLIEQAIAAEESGFQLCRGLAGSRSVTVLKTGMGAIGFAAFLTAHLIHNRYDALVVAGLAGALDPALKKTDAIVYDRCADGRSGKEKSISRDENASIACHDRLSEILYLSLIKKGISCVRGSGLTLGRVVTGSSEKIVLGQQFNASAVDMETYDMLEVCRRSGIPAAAVRVISDDAIHDIPDFNRAAGSNGRLKDLSLLTAMIASPVISIRFLLGIRNVVNALRASLGAIMDA